MSAKRQQRPKAAPRTARADEDREVARRSLTWTKRSAILTGLGILVAIAIAVVSILITSPQGPASSHAAAPNIEVDSMTAQYVASSSGIPARPVILDFEIRNTGNQLAIIKAARVTIQQFAALPVCFSAGALESTGTYHAFLPETPSPGTSIDIPTAQQVAGDAADRFDVTLGLPAGHPFNPDIYVCSTIIPVCQPTQVKQW
jgi:hypothetical protein